MRGKGRLSVGVPAAIGILATGIALYVFTRPESPVSKVRAVAEGMTEEQVEGILGPPQHRAYSYREGIYQGVWEEKPLLASYWAWGGEPRYPYMVTVLFGRHRKVTSPYVSYRRPLTEWLRPFRRLFG